MSNLRNSKILVAVDGSEESIKAANFAVDIAKTYTSQVIALVVSYIPLSIKLSSTDRLEKWHENNIKEAKEWLKDIINLTDEFKISFRLEVLETTSSIVRTIIEYAERENVRLIVVGTTGRSGFSRALLGSVASGVAAHAKCTVIVER
jgi:nucleotide-binding universal stress UspA family protein